MCLADLIYILVFFFLPFLVCSYFYSIFCKLGNRSNLISLVENYLIAKTNSTPPPTMPHEFDYKYDFAYTFEVHLRSSLSNYEIKLIDYYKEIEKSILRLLNFAFVFVTLCILEPVLYCILYTLDTNDFFCNSYIDNYYSTFYISFLAPLIFLGFKSITYTVTNGKDVFEQKLKAIIEMQSKKDSELPTVQIGDYFGGGIVFAIDENGKHGLICLQSPVSIGSTYDNCVNWDGKDLLGNQAIEFYELGAPVLFCYKFKQEGFEDWYLPSSEELSIMHNNLRDLDRKVVNFSLKVDEQVGEWSINDLLFKNSYEFWVQNASNNFLQSYQLGTGRKRIYTKRDSTFLRILPIRKF